MAEPFDSVVRDFIDFVNMQVGAYMDALAGYAGHYTRVERQVHRVMRPKKVTTDEAGRKVVVAASYEDPSKPDIVLNRIVRASDYLAANAKGGSNEQQHARAIMIFIFTYWELEIRPRLAKCLQVGLCVAVRGRVRITVWPVVPAPASAGASIPQASYIRCFIFSMASGERDSLS